MIPKTKQKRTSYSQKLTHISTLIYTFHNHACRQSIEFPLIFRITKKYSLVIVLAQTAKQKIRASMQNREQSINAQPFHPKRPPRNLFNPEVHIASKPLERNQPAIIAAKTLALNRQLSQDCANKGEGSSVPYCLALGVEFLSLCRAPGDWFPGECSRRARRRLSALECRSRARQTCNPPAASTAGIYNCTHARLTILARLNECRVLSVSRDGLVYRPTPPVRQVFRMGWLNYWVIILSKLKILKDLQYKNKRLIRLSQNI